ncbi:MAG: hypothetical protein SFY80_01165 [Verrucomicrobiota bacterium]|nr:hypothetical protein [Verrucomicrobiota bacterium]
MNTKTTSKYTIIFYIITPLLLMVAFTVFFKDYSAKEFAKSEAARIVQEEKNAAEAKKKAELEEQLKIEAERLRQAREEAAFKAEKEEEAKRQKEIDQQKQLIAKVQEETDRYRNDIIKYSDLVKEERAKRKELEDKVWALARENETIRVAKNMNDMESQRLSEMLSNRVKGEWSRQLMIQQALTPPAQPSKK